MALFRQLMRLHKKPSKAIFGSNVKLVRSNKSIEWQDYKLFGTVDKLLNQTSSRIDNNGWSAADDHKNEEHIKENILNAALNHVPHTGWNTDAMVAAAEELGLAPSVSSMFKDYDLVNFFITKSNIEFEKHLSENQLNARNAIEWRLNKVVPYAKGYSEAIAIVSQPEHLKHSVNLLLKLADSIVHHSLKDTSTNINWYTKRMAIAGIYASCEMCLIQDKSEGYSVTWKFLDRRAQDIEKLQKGELSLGNLPELIHAGCTTILNVFGRNPPR